MTSGRRAVPGLAKRLRAVARCVSLTGSVLLGIVRAAPAQAYASRATLEQELRAVQGRDEARLIKARLDSGDFRSGDRILLTVEGEKELSDTFTVGMAAELTLPQIGVIPLTGVLRAELSTRLTQALGRYLRSPVVRVRSLIRVSIEGEVGRPGFYALAPEMALMDALTAAGGLTRDAKLEKARIEREGAIVMSGRTLESAVRSGRTLDALNLRAGDRVFVPRRSDFTKTVQTLSILATIPVAIYTIIKIF